MQETAQKPTFKVGDVVEWTTRCRHKETTKRGTILELVPARTLITKLMLLGRYPESKFNYMTLVRPSWREVDAYLIKGGKGGNCLYFPNPSLLHLAIEAVV